MADKKFASMLYKFKTEGYTMSGEQYARIFDGAEFTGSQLMELCQCVDKLHLFAVEKLASHKGLTSDHINTFILNATTVDKGTLLSLCEGLTPDHLETLLNSSSYLVRGAAYEHPKCTDEQKVKYLLLRDE